MPRARFLPFVLPAFSAILIFFFIHDTPHFSALDVTHGSQVSKQPLPLAAPEQLETWLFYEAIDNATLRDQFFLSTRGPVEMLPKWEPTTMEAKDLEKLRTGFKEAILLAFLTYNEMNKCDPAWDRYFRPEDWDWVRSVFGFISGAFDNNSPLGTTYIPKVLTYYLGDHGLADEDQCASDEDQLGYSNAIPSDDPPLQQYTFTSICTRALDAPLLSEVSCDDLGNVDSDEMNTLGGTILHELLHVPAFISRLPHHEKLLHWGNSQDKTSISDYEQPDDVTSPPDDGYGPTGAEDLRMFQGRYVCRSNADNYVFYALSRYWSKKCGKAFKGVREL